MNKVNCINNLVLEAAYRGVIPDEDLDKMIKERGKEMEYINKRLPIMEVGMAVNWGNTTSGVHCYEDGTLHCTQSALDLLIQEGFIEEVKPRREVYVYYDCDHPLAVYPKPWNEDNSSLIKFIEVV